MEFTATCKANGQTVTIVDYDASRNMYQVRHADGTLGWGRMDAFTIATGTRVMTPNGNPGTVVGYMDKGLNAVAVKLDNGRQIGCLASKVVPIPPKTQRDKLSSVHTALMVLHGQVNALTREAQQASPRHLSDNSERLLDAQMAISDAMSKVYEAMYPEG